jgi:hypothetical protein
MGLGVVCVGGWMVAFAFLFGLLHWWVWWCLLGGVFVPKGIIRNGFPIVAELWILMWETS